MSNQTTIDVATTVISEFYAPAAMADDLDDLQCTLSRKINYTPSAGVVSSFDMSYSVSANLPSELGSDTETGSHILSCMADGMHLHHVAESLRTKFAAAAQADGDVGVALQLALRSIDQATRDLSGLLEIASSVAAT